MATAGRREPLAGADSAWLRMDEPANRMVVTLVLMFEQPIAFQRIRHLVETRLVQLPRFRQRVVERRRLRLATCWEEDPHFDLDRHLEEIELDDPSDEASLHRLVSTVLSNPLDRARPLWHFYFVPRYRDGSALVTRIHHCIGDGFGLIYAFLAMADDPTPLTAACGSTSGSVRQCSRFATLGDAISRGSRTLTRLLLMPRDQPHLKGPLTIEKRATWSAPVPLEQVKAVGRAHGASVNDVLLAAVSGGLHRYLSSRKPIEGELSVRGVVPVNLRPLEEAHELGNRFGLVFLPLPVGSSEPARRLQEVCRRMDAIKRSPEPLVTFQILRAIGVAPRWVFDFVVGLFGKKATAVVTNVIGPREMVTYAGVRLSQAMFWVPCAGRLGLGISVLSYAGRVSIGFSADAGLIPDPERIVEGFESELAQLYEHAQIAAGRCA